MFYIDWLFIAQNAEAYFIFSILWQIHQRCKAKQTIYDLTYERYNEILHWTSITLIKRKSHRNLYKYICIYICVLQKCPIFVKFRLHSLGNFYCEKNQSYCQYSFSLCFLLFVYFWSRNRNRKYLKNLNLKNFL